MLFLPGILLIGVGFICESAFVRDENITIETTTTSTTTTSEITTAIATTTSGHDCTASTGALKMNQLLSGLYVSWDLNVASECYYRYSISIETIAQPPLKPSNSKPCYEYVITAKLSASNSTQLIVLNRNYNLKNEAPSESSSNRCTYEFELNLVTSFFTTNLVTVYYQINEIYPCTKYQISLDLLQDNGQIAAHSVDLIDTDSVALNQTENLTIKSTIDSILLSWKANKYADICKISYNIYMVKEKQAAKAVPYYRNENRTQHEIHNLESCTFYNVSVIPSNMTWNSDSEYENYKDVPYMIHRVSTLPEGVSNIDIEDTGSAKTISWTPPFNSDCIKEYQVVVNKSTLTTSNNYIDIDHNTYCVDIAVIAISWDTSQGKAVHILKPGPVQALTSYPESSSITISWLPPLNINCLKDYVVRLNNEVWSTILAEFTFEDLVPCTEYEMQVSAKSTDNITGSYVSVLSTTHPPEELGPPINLTVQYENNSLTLNWEPPRNAQACSISYVVNITNNKGKEIIKSETSENLQTIDFSSAIGCMEYTILVTPEIFSIAKKGKSSKLITQFNIVRDAPTCSLFKTNKNSAILECKIGTVESNLCALYNITVICKASDFINQIKNTKKSEEIIENYTFKKGLADSTVQIIINNLSVFTNYTCIGYVTNTAGRSLPSVPISFQTQENIPAAPQHVRITDITNTSFTVRWYPPEYIQGALLKYIVGIDYKGPIYYVPSDCVAQESDTQLIDVDQLANEYTFTGTFPAFKYSVFVQAVTGAGSGEKYTLDEVVTEAGVPDEPRNVDFVINTAEGTTFDANVTISWWYPCYTNGIIKHFSIELFHIAKDSEKVTEQKILVVNSAVLESTNFNSEFRLLPAHDYIVTVTTVTAENFESNPVKLTFTSPETYPDAPLLKPVMAVHKNTFVIEWNEPKFPNGILTNYTINVINEGALHKVPRDCVQEPIAYQFLQLPDLTTLKFESGLPNHKYSINIAAATKVGYSLPSDPIFVETSQSEPEEIRDARIILNNYQMEDYNVTATVTFKYPCNTNGPFKHFLVNTFGSRTNYPIDKNKINLEGYIDQDNILTFKVLPAHNYLINIQVVTEHYLSEFTSVAFSSPAGIPPAVNKDAQIPPPKSYNTTFTEIVLNRNMFSYVNGRILYYAVIIASNNDEVQPSFGIWDGINWPQVKFGYSKQNIIAAYQASSSFWNPFDGNNLPFFAFIIGDTSFSKTNVPLQPQSSYKVLVRGFTQNGYRDSSAVQFTVPGIDDTDLALIFGLSFGIIGTIILIIIAVICKRRHRWVSKKNSIKLAHLTPLSVSIERFPEYYTKIKNSSEMIKEEFLLLTRKSNALVLSTSEAQRPENKKKNRYSNILPYDETRVKLINVDENSDYINASYIQGYSGKTEYIATQGPLEHTCSDFWEMVIQESTSLIVMIAQFVELNKQKCFKYFPDNHENVELESGISIRCCTELSFKSYTVRTLLVQKDLRQWTITHLQFTEWPDFGCPEGTENTLEFSQLIRKHAERNQDPIIVHCSAGVGRTGTLIALDILFQTLANKDDIDIFGTVFNLRKDRKNMVQTEKQYLYIHECVNVALANPECLQTNRDITREAIYENLEEIRNNKIDNGITESVL